MKAGRKILIWNGRENPNNYTPQQAKARAKRRRKRKVTGR